MTKHHWRKQIRSFFESHADPDTDETLRQTQKDMVEKKERIIKLIKGTEEARDGGGESMLIRTPSRNGHIQELVEDFHKQYQTLYELYENLTGDLKKKAHSKIHEDDDDNDSTSSSDSESDLDDHSPKGKVGKRNGKLETSDKTLQQELQIANNQISNLQRELNVVTNEKEKVEQTIEDLKVDCENWKLERSQLMAEKEDMKAKLDSSTKLESELQQRIERLIGENNPLRQEKEDISKRAEDAERTLEELKATVVAVENEKGSLSAELETSRQEVSDLKNLLDATNSEISNRNASISESSSTQIKELEDKFSHLEVELDVLKSQQRITEDQLVSKTAEVSYFKERVSELEEAIKGGENEVNNVQGSLEKLTQLEKENSELKTKIERMEEEAKKASQINEERVAELQKTIEYLKSDIEEEREEIFSVEEKNRTLEVRLRLSNQKVRVTEQLLNEKEEIHRTLEKKNSVLSEAIKAYTGMVKDISTQVNDSMNEFELSILKKFEEDYKEMSRIVSGVSNQIQSVEDWVRSIRMRKEEMEALTSELEKMRDDGLVMKEKIERLEEELTREKVEKEEMARALSQVESTVRELGMNVKEKDERLICLGDEKREAIRQLCLWVEYQRNRYEDLKGVLLKTSRSQRAN